MPGIGNSQLVIVSSPRPLCERSTRPFRRRVTHLAHPAGRAATGIGSRRLHSHVPPVERETAEPYQDERDDRQRRRIDGREAIPQRRASRVVVER